jgi:hypothetical protein
MIMDPLGKPYDVSELDAQEEAMREGSGQFKDWLIERFVVLNPKAGEHQTKLVIARYILSHPTRAIRNPCDNYAL